MLPDLEGENYRKNANLGLFRRFPARTLYEFIVRRYGDLHTAAAVLDLQRHTISSWGYKDQRLSTYHADEMACRLGVHPCVIWPEWFDIDPAQEEKVCRRREQNRQRRESKKAMSLQSMT